MGNEVAKQSKVMELSHYLDSRKSALAAVLPKHLTPERLAKIACAAVSRTPKLMNCTVPSLYMAVTQAAQLGLEPGLQGSCYLVPFGNQATLVVGYRGLMNLCRQSGSVKKIEARVVYENDKFDYEFGLVPSLVHVPGTGTVADRGKMTHAYAIAWLTNGEKQFEVLDSAEIDKIRRSSKASGSGPWVDWTEEMWKKCPVRRLTKYLPMSIEMKQAMEIEDAVEGGKAPLVGINGEEVFEAEVVNSFEPEAEPSETQKKVHDQIKKKTGKKPDPPKQKSLEPEPEVPDGKFTVTVTGDLDAARESLEQGKFKYEETMNCYALVGQDYNSAKRWVEFLGELKSPDGEVIKLEWQVLSEASGEIVPVEPY